MGQILDQQPTHAKTTHLPTVLWQCSAERYTTFVPNVLAVYNKSQLCWWGRGSGGKRKWHNQAKLIVATFAMLKREFMLQNKLKMQIANAHHPHFAGSAVEGALQSQYSGFIALF